MSKYKQNINKHLISAKEWLTRAEQSFDKEKDVRGELDLFLAQAELLHAKKASRSRRRFDKFPLFKEALALLAALFVVAVGLGASYQLNNEANQTLSKVPLRIGGPLEDSQSNYQIVLMPSDNNNLDKAQNLLQIGNEKTAFPPTGKQTFEMQNNMFNLLPTSKTEAKSERPGETIVISGPQLKREKIHSPTPVSISKEEMQKLIRSAGKSLRNE